MSTDNRFKPPAAVVDDVGVVSSRVPLVRLAQASLLQFLWFGFKADAFVELANANALSPIGLVLAVAGEACLFVAIVRAAWRHVRPQKTFVAAVVLLAACVVVWRSLDFWLLGVFVLGMALAAIGWTIARARAPAEPHAG